MPCLFGYEWNDEKSQCTRVLATEPDEVYASWLEQVEEIETPRDFCKLHYENTTIGLESTTMNSVMNTTIEIPMNTTYFDTDSVNMCTPALWERKGCYGHFKWDMDRNDGNSYQIWTFVDIDTLLNGNVIITCAKACEKD